MRLLVHSQGWFPESGPPQRRWAWLADELNMRGFDITVVTPRPRSNLRRKYKARRANGNSQRIELSDRNLRDENILRVPYLTTGDGILSKALNQLFVSAMTILASYKYAVSNRHSKPDLIVGTVPAIPTVVSTSLASKLLGVPYVLDLRDPWPDLLNVSEEWDSGLKSQSIIKEKITIVAIRLLKRLARKVIEHSITNAGGIIVTSESFRKQIVLHCSKSKKVDASRVILVRNVFPTNVRKEPLSDKAPRDEVKHNLNVLYAGTVGRAQGLENAIKAVALAKNMGVDVSLKIFGDGAERNRLEEVTREQSLDIEINAAVTAEELSKLYEWADSVLVHLRGWTPLEMAVPSKLYELLELSKHVTAVVSGETACLVAQHEAGAVVEPNHPLDLANAWRLISENPSSLDVPDAGNLWIKRLRNTTIDEELVPFLQKYSTKD